MNESDTDAGLEESGQPEEEAQDGSTPEKDVELAAEGAGEEIPWTPPSEEEHRALLEIKEKADALVEDLLRAKADFENFKKQKTRQAAQDRDVAVRGFIEGLLPVIDNFERAIESADEQQAEAGGVLEGVGLTHQMIIKLLEDNGVSVVEAEGRQFDPDFHEAVLEEEVAEGSTGDILEVFEKGYLHGDILIRPSRVKVAKRVDGGREETGADDGES